jgi:cytochrome c553
MKTLLKVSLVSAAVLTLPALAGAATAQENWDAQCKKCHAADGSGSGAMGKKLKLKDYTSAEVQAAMTDDQIVDAIKNGAKDEKTGKQTMPAYADKFSAEEITDLLAHIRAMKK